MVLFRRDMGCTCFVPALSGASCVFMAANTAARLFFGVNLNAAKTGQGSMSHFCTPCPPLWGWEMRQGKEGMRGRWRWGSQPGISASALSSSSSGPASKS